MMSNPMLSRYVTWRCEPCGVEERFEEHATDPRCWVCGGLMQWGEHPDWPVNSRTSVFIPRTWLQAHDDRRTA